MRMTGNIYLIIILILCVSLNEKQVNCKRVLAVFPVPSFSHQIVYRSLCLALHKKGYEIVIATTDPLRDSSLTNYTEIDISSFYDVFRNVAAATRFRTTPHHVLRKYLEHLHIEFLNRTLDLPEFRKMYAKDSNEKFDVIIIEAYSLCGLYGLGYKLNAPVIGISSTDLNRYHHYIMGHPLLPSHPSNWEDYKWTGENLPFWQRITNFVWTWLHIYRWNTYMVHRTDMAARHFLGNDLPPIQELEKNVSLFFFNQFLEIGYGRPTNPKLIFFNGLHIKKKLPVIPKDMKVFLDNAKNGFIYISFGTNARPTEFPPRILDDIFKVFSKLPYRILWKYDADQLPWKLGNVLVSRWIPQQSVLAHPNIKLFIYQGGLQSTEEAIHYSVPILGIPLMFDQGFRITKLASLGVAKHLDLEDINQDTFYDAICDVVNDTRYKEKMVELSKLVKDKPYESLEHLVWWVEYVVRHQGAPHLQYGGVYDPWYKKFDMDIFALIGIILFIIISLLCIILFKTLKWVLRVTNKSISRREKVKTK